MRGGAFERARRILSNLSLYPPQRTERTVDFIKKIKEKIENAKKEAMAQMKYSSEDAIKDH